MREQLVHARLDISGTFLAVCMVVIDRGVLLRTSASINGTATKRGVIDLF